jgi:hypothetical protein
MKYEDFTLTFFIKKIKKSDDGIRKITAILSESCTEVHWKMNSRTKMGKLSSVLDGKIKRQNVN